MRFVGLLLFLPAMLLANDWPRWRGPDGNGISKETGWSTAWPNEGPKQLWKAAVGIGFSSVTVAGGRVFTMGNSNETDTVFCFDENTGKELWKHSYPCPLDPKYYEGGPGSSPTCENDRVYTFSKRGHLFCFDAAGGKVLWQTNLLDGLGVKKPEWGFAGSPVVEGNLLLLNVGEAGTAVDKNSGRVVWTSGKEMAGYATPVLYNNGSERLALIFSSGALVGVSAKTGKEHWRFPWVERWHINAADPILAGNKIFISTFGKGCALLEMRGGNTPNVVWENENMGNHFNSCVLVNGFIYGNNGNTDKAEKDFRCLALSDGSVKWSYSGLGLGSVTVADNRLIILSDRGELVVAEVSPEAFKPIARAQVLGGKCWTVPVLANGRIYCRNAQGTLICLDVRRS
ncbi:MAG TPA: PQQ-binding-like beta-propeller repeat protein [Verrucomicrobiae bacterium]|nr:PQQ-binding-like beta-propeller repeat protein [Verrucomicrobiae bacterium]